MPRQTKTWLTLLAFAAVLTLAFALLALVLYERTERGVVEKHSQDQMVLAQLASTALTQQLDNLRHLADRLALELHATPERNLPRALAALAHDTADIAVFFVAPGGTYYFRDPPLDQAALEAATRPWAGHAQAVVTNPFPLGASPAQLALLVPVSRRGRMEGQLGLAIPFEPLIKRFFPAAAAPPHLSVSLLDEDGNVLANTRHPEMAGRRIPRREQSCLPCHTSFALERRMLAGEAGADRLQVGRQPLALVAFTPVRVLGRRWSLALSEPYSAIIADTRQGFRAITVLLGFSLLVGILATALTLQYRLQRRRAEERAELAERRTALERQLLQTRQLAAIGKMTSQIAHQINTPLATLGLNVSYLQAEVARSLGGANQEIEEVSNAIAAEIDRLKRVVNDYLRFARLPQPVLAVESLQAALESFVDFIEPEARERSVHLEIALGRDPAYVQLDADLFRQAFLNLVRNGFEAMPNGGSLRIRLHREADELVVRLEDTGGGIPADILPHIFDPFFTTKKDGTGLGLAHTRRVIDEHGGTIRCESTPGHGTAFEVRLPAAPAPTEIPKPLSLVEKGR